MIVQLGDEMVVATVPKPDENGLRWKLVDLVDWYSSPPVTSDIEDAPQSDQAFDAERSYRGAKSMTLEGMVTASSTEAAIAFGWQVIAGLAPVGESMTLTVEDPTGTYTMQVRLNGLPKVAPFTDRRARFQIPLTAPDGRKYGPWETTPTKPAGGAAEDGLIYPLFGPVGTGVLDFGAFSPSGLVSIENPGKAESWPIFRIQGLVNSPGFQIVSDTSILQFSGGVPLGQQLILSPYAGGRAIMGGVDVTGAYLIRSEWASILPGQTRSYVFNPLGTYDGNATLFVDFRKAWW